VRARPMSWLYIALNTSCWLALGSKEYLLGLASGAAVWMPMCSAKSGTDRSHETTPAFIPRSSSRSSNDESLVGFPFGDDVDERSVRRLLLYIMRRDKNSSLLREPPGVGR